MLFVPNKKGFTLIELLVVISIIGVLVAVATANMITAQKQARDSRRMADLQSAQAAMETYFSSFGVYPEGAVIDTAFDSGARPTDPKGDPYSWLTQSDSYCICTTTTLESKPGNASSTGSTLGCNWDATNGTYFCVQNRQ